MTDHYDIRIDLQVDGMGARGHKWFINEPWQDVYRWGCAMAQVYNCSVEATMCRLEHVHIDGEHSHNHATPQEFIGRFVRTDDGAQFVEAAVYEEVG